MTTMYTADALRALETTMTDQEQSKYLDELDALIAGVPRGNGRGDSLMIRDAIAAKDVIAVLRGVARLIDHITGDEGRGAPEGILDTLLPLVLPFVIELLKKWLLR